ncbi:hypothetical protein [Coleofasciculus sp.]|uniref:hypothetical protein n=1 Tax=Coleofasciculus sp. TaxID=3100458 RepID=UPI003A1F41D7
MSDKQDFICLGVSNAKVGNIAVDSVRQIFPESLEVLLTRRHQATDKGDWSTLMTSQHLPMFLLFSLLYYHTHL